MTIKRRAHDRVPYTEPVRFFEWNKARSAQASEISVGGIFLQTAGPLNEGTLVTLRLAFPGSPSGFTALGRVVRTVRGSGLRPSGMGISFVDIPCSGRQMIEAYVAQRSSSSAQAA
jgi:uncharacterized protein (TIGR02266 family)